MADESDYVDERKHNPRVVYEKQNAILKQDVKELLIWKAGHKNQSKNDEIKLEKHNVTLYHQENGLVTQSIQIKTAIRTLWWVGGIFAFLLTLFVTLFVTWVKLGKPQ